MDVPIETECTWQTMDDTAMDILIDAEKTICDKAMWMPMDTDIDWSNNAALIPVLAWDEHGNRCAPTSSDARRWTLLGALDLAAQKHFSPGAKAQRIAMNAMQCAIEGWISLGDYNNKWRQQEQRSAVAGIDDYIDDEMARDGHNRCLSILEDAKKVLAKVRDAQ